MAETACGNCGEILGGAYCHACGQRRLGDADRRLGHLLGQFAAAATDLDGRFWRSLRALVLEPGRLSRDYLDGRRRQWMAPMSLFLLANVLYFLAPTTLSDFNLSLHEQMGQVHAPLSVPMVDARVARRDAAARRHWATLPADRRGPTPPSYTRADYARDYEAQAGNVGKALIIVHVPFLALGLALLFWRRRLYFAEHLVVATHLFTVLLLYVPLFLLPLGALFRLAGPAGDALLGWLVAASALLLLAHVALTLRRVYAPPAWIWLLAPLPLLVLMMLGNQYLYRGLQFALTFALT